MGVAFFIVLEHQIDGLGLNTTVDGKNLARQIGLLDTAARRLGVRPLSDFFGYDQKDAAKFLDGADDLPPLQYFSALDGLATVKALLTQPEAQTAILELQGCERHLTAAAKHGVGWCLAADF
jgi:hypothetical protein